MAEGVLFKIAEGIIGQLGNTALQEIGLLWGINDELEKLKNTVTAIQVVLLDAEEKQSLNNAIKTWLGGLKDVVFEADDLLDDFSTEALRREAMTQNKKAKQLTSMPLFPNLEALFLDNSSLKPLQQTVMSMTNTTPPEIVTSTTEIASISSSSSVATSSFAPLSKLKTLRLSGMVEPLPKELLRNFTSINYLDIHNSRCPLTRVLRHLTALNILRISDFDGDEMEWQELNSLNTLGFWNFSEVSLPVGLQHVTSLKSLDIWDSPSLLTIPECICNLKFLQRLHIRNCPNLTSLPEGFRALTSLQTLTIEKCPILLQRCKRETGEDWSKIAHIQNLELYSDETQDEPDSKKTWRLTKIFGHCNCSTSQQLND